MKLFKSIIVIIERDQKFMDGFFHSIIFKHFNEYVRFTFLAEQSLSFQKYKYYTIFINRKYICYKLRTRQRHTQLKI